MPPSLDEWLARAALGAVMVEVVEGLDPQTMSGIYRG
jgi:hypothetical protein